MHLVDAIAAGWPRQSIVGNTTSTIGSTVSSLFGAVMYYPMSIVNSIMGTNADGETLSLRWSGGPVLPLACVLCIALYRSSFEL